MPKDYGETCALARALDVVGERWTLLIVRELLAGPKRFIDLLDGLPGIPPSLLSSRLKGMQASGLLQKETLPPPAGSTVYRLTPAGAELEGALIALGGWGMKHGRRPRPGDASRSGWLVVVLRGLFHPDDAAGLHETYELRLPEGPLRLAVNDRVLTVAEGSASNPQVVLEGTQPAVMAVLTGWVPAQSAVKRRDLRIRGDRKALARLLAAFAAPGTPLRVGASAIQ